MINFLVKTFIKDSDDVDNPIVRQNYGIFAGIVGIICNVFLFAFKFVAGIITGAVSISADAFNNLSDARCRTPLRAWQDGISVRSCRFICYCDNGCGIIQKLI